MMVSVASSLTATLTSYSGEEEISKEVDCLSISNGNARRAGSEASGTTRGSGMNGSMNGVQPVKGNIYSKAESIHMRHQYICGANKLFFKDQPLKIVRGENYLVACFWRVYRRVRRS